MTFRAALWAALLAVAPWAWGAPVAPRPSPGKNEASRPAAKAPAKKLAAPPSRGLIPAGDATLPALPLTPLKPLLPAVDEAPGADLPSELGKTAPADHPTDGGSPETLERAREAVEAGLRRGLSAEVFSDAKQDASVTEPAPRQETVAPVATDAPKDAPTQPLGPATPPSYEFAHMLKITRGVFDNPRASKFLQEMFAEELTLDPDLKKRYRLHKDVKELSESQFMLLLQYNQPVWPLLEQYAQEFKKMAKLKPDSAEFQEWRKAWRERAREFVKDERLKDIFKKLNNMVRAFQFFHPADESGARPPGYRITGMYANSRRWVNGALTEKPDDLKKVALDFINGAGKQLMGSFYDFDMPDVGEAIEKRIDAGVSVLFFIDKTVYDARPEVRAVVDKLNAKKRGTVLLVESGGLHHHKMMIRDWDDKEKAAGYLSSGNLTQSCIGPEGDLEEFKRRPKDSVPNANHTITMDSYLVAQVVFHQLSKLMPKPAKKDKNPLVTNLKGRKFPLIGAWKFFGEKKADAKEPPYVVMSFSPRGTLGNVNNDFLRRILDETSGRLGFAQFAFSSDEVGDGVIERAERERKAGNEFVFIAVGETPFALAGWSQFLRLIGYRLDKGGAVPKYVKIGRPALERALGKRRFAEFLKSVRAAPSQYRSHNFPVGDGDIVVFNAKVHDKSMVSGNVAIAGTSFNFSVGALTNQEQILAFHDPELANWMWSVIEGLYQQSRSTLEEAALRKNAWWAENKQEADLPDDAESKGAKDSIEKRRRRRAPPKPKT